MSLRLKLLVTTAVAAALLSGNLFAQGAGEQQQASSDDGPVEIEYYDWTGCEDVVKAFNATHTDIQVNEHILPTSDYETKLLTLLSGRADIDCFMEKRPNDMFAQYKNGYIAAMDDFIANSDESIKAIELNEDSCKATDGSIVLMPFRSAAHYTYYNKKIFEELGIPTPDTYVKNGEWTWEKFEEVADEIHEANSDYVGASIYTWPNEALFIAGQAKNPVLDADGTIYEVDPLLQQLSMRKRMEEKGSMWSLIDMKIQKTNYSKQFGDGNLAMLLMGEWFPATLKQMTESDIMRGFTIADVGITRMPCDAPTYITTGSVPVGNCITGYSKKQQASFEFLKWMSGEEGAVEVAKTGNLPSVSNDEVKKIFAETVGDPQSLDYYLEEKPNFVSNFSPFGSRVNTVIDEMQEDYLLGNLTDEQFTTQFKQELQDIVDSTY
jgi:multiple sugar transport system substrate-binding protein